jgi:predicted permease
LWGLLLVGVGFLLSIPWYVLPNLENMLLGAGQASSLLLGALYPFSTGILIAKLGYANLAFQDLSEASVVLTISVLLAIVAGKWSLDTVRSISQGAGVKVARLATEDYSVVTHSQTVAYVLKDLRTTSRNPSTAFFFALPVLESVIIALMISNLAALRTVMIINATSLGAILALLTPLALLTVEGRGLEYTRTLPISARRIIVSKTLVSTATYVLVPLALAVLSLVKPVTSTSSILIPFLIIPSVASASIFEIRLFLRTAAKNRIDAVINDLEKLVVGSLTVILPCAMYAAVFLSSFNHTLSLLSMGATAFSELAMASYFLSRS